MTGIDPDTKAGRVPSYVTQSLDSDGGRVKPNFILLAVGLLVIVVTLAALLVPQTTSAIAANPTVLPFIPYIVTLLVAMGFALTLFGAMPSPDIGGGAIYGFRVVGPAAVALVTFLLLRQREEPPARPPYIVLQAGNTRLNAVSLGSNDSVQILDVDSFSDDKLQDVLVKLRTSLGADALLEPAVNKQLGALRFSGAAVTERVHSLVQSFLQGKNVDGEWKRFVDDMIEQNRTSDPDLKERIKKQPFFIAEISAPTGSRREMFTAGEDLQVGVQHFAVPIIANPSLKVIRGLTEGIVLQQIPE